MKNKIQNKAKYMVIWMLIACMIIHAATPYFADTKNETIHISSVEDFLEFSKNCSNDVWSAGKTVVLDNDISCKDVEIEPVPYFAGTFDGQGHVISDVEINGKYYPSGLFGTVGTQAVISDLLVNGTIMPTGTQSAVGGIVGQNYGTIKNVTFSGIVSGKTNVGGIVGENKAGATVSDSVLKGYVFGESATGGIVGRNQGSILNCSNEGCINNSNEEPARNLEDIGNNLLEDLYFWNSSDVTGAATDTGGIAGYSGGIIGQCSNHAIIGYVHIGYNVGGIVGRNSGYLYECKNYGEIFGRKDVGGIVGQAEPYIRTDITETKLVELENQISALEGQVDTALSHMDGMRTELKNGIANISSYMGEIRTELDILHQLVNEENKNISEGLTEVGNTAETIGAIIESIETSVENLEQKLADLESLLEVMENNGIDGVQELKENIGAIRKDLEEIQTNIENIHNTTSDESIKTYVASIKTLLEDTGTLLETMLNSMDTILKSIEETIQFVEEEWPKVKATIEEYTQKIQDFIAILEKLPINEETWQQLQDFLNTLEKMLDKYEEIVGVLEKIYARILEAGIMPIEQNQAARTVDSTNANTQIAELKQAIQDMRNEIAKVQEDIKVVQNAESDAQPEEKVQTIIDSLYTIMQSSQSILTKTDGMLSSIEQDMEELAQNLKALQSQKENITLSLDEITGYIKEIVKCIQGTDVSGAMENVQDFQTSANLSVDAVVDSLGKIFQEAENIESALGTKEDALYNDVNVMKNQITLITDTIRDYAEETMDSSGETIQIETTEADISAITNGKIMTSVNYASVCGDLNTGGIAGNMSVEYEIDPEKELSEDISWKERKSYELKSVLYACTNKGNVTAKKDAVGGICGQMELGLIHDCQAYASATSESGDYVGGIAGITKASITNCIAKNSLSGNKYVGGITGSGYAQEDGGSKIADCLSMVMISECEQFEGAIAGIDMGNFSENYFVSSDLEGINRISYSGKAQKVSYEDFLYLADSISDIKSFTLSFVADEKVIQTVDFSYGDSFGEEIFPKVPEKDGYLGKWNLTDLSTLCFDTVVTAEYIPYITALRTDEVRDNERPIFFVEGNFSSEDEITAVQETITEELSAEFMFKGKIKEYWTVAFSDDGQNRHTLRFLPPEHLENAKLYVKENGTWVRAETEEFGSYKVFQVAGNDAEVVLIPRTYGIVMILLLILFVIAITIGIVVFLVKRGTMKKIGTKKMLIGAIIIAVLFGIAWICHMIMLPKTRISAELVNLSSDLLSEKNQSMNLNLEVAIGEEQIELDTMVYLLNEMEEPVVVLEKNGHSIYMTGDVLYMENGKAYALGKTGHTHFTEKILELYKAIDVTRTQEQDVTIYSVAVKGEDAKTLMDILIPSAEGQILKAGDVIVEIFAKDGVLQKLEIEGNAILKNTMETQVNVSAVLSKFKELKSEEYELPDSVAKAISTTDSETLESMEKERYQFLLAWTNFNAKEEEGTVAFQVSCGPINLKKEQDWQTVVQGLSELENTKELENIPDLLYEICMEGEFSSEKIGENYQFELKLDEKTMETLAKMIAPEIETQAVTLTSGTVEITTQDNKISSFQIQIDGKVKVLLSEVEASIQAEFKF